MVGASYRKREGNGEAGYLTRDRLGIAADLSWATSVLELATVPSSSKERSFEGAAPTDHETHRGIY